MIKERLKILLDLFHNNDTLTKDEALALYWIIQKVKKENESRRSSKKHKRRNI